MTGATVSAGLSVCSKSWRSLTSGSVIAYYLRLILGSQAWSPRDSLNVVLVKLSRVGLQNTTIMSKFAKPDTHRYLSLYTLVGLMVSKNSLCEEL